MKIELLIFSGRPNPSWWLSAEEVKNLQTLLNKLEQTIELVIPQQLGYCGFVCSCSQLRIEINVHHEKVIVKKKQIEYFLDRDKVVENFLLSTSGPYKTLI